MHEEPRVEEPKADEPGAAQSANAPVAIEQEPSAPAPVDPAPPAAAATGWAIQIGSFASRENAERLTQELKSKGFAAFVSQGGGSRRLYRVRVGPEADRPAAEALAARLRGAGQTGSIVAHP